MGMEGRMGALPSPWIARAYFTPASVRTAAGERLRGGPGSEKRLSKVSGAPRLAVKMTGISAVASSFAIWN